jgi:hypothetical protein
VLLSGMLIGLLPGNISIDRRHAIADIPPRTGHSGHTDYERIS